MRNLLFALLIGVPLIAVSCGNSLEKKAEKLIVPYMQDLYNDPSIYEPIQTVVDTAYAPMDDYSLICDVMSLFDSLHEQDILGQRVNLSKEALDNATKNTYYALEYRYESDVWNLTEKLKDNISLLDAIIVKVNSGKEFPIGFKAQHVFRIKHPDLLQYTDNDVFYLNIDISTIVGHVDLEDEQYQKAKDFLWSIRNGHEEVSRLRYNLESIIGLFE